MVGRTVVLTRERGDNDELRGRLRGVAVDVVEMPCIRVEPLRDATVLARAVAALLPQDWLVVTSRHGADAVAPFVPSGARIAAIGPATEERLREHGLPPSFRPSRATGERLGSELPETEGLALLARAERATRDLPAILRRRGMRVGEVAAYRTVAEATGDVARVRELLAASAPVTVLFHSPSAVDGLLGSIEPRLLSRAELLVSGPATLRAVRERVGPGARVELMGPSEVTHVANA